MRRLAVATADSGELLMSFGAFAHPHVADDQKQDHQADVLPIGNMVPRVRDEALVELQILDGGFPDGAQHDALPHPTYFGPLKPRSAGAKGGLPECNFGISQDALTGLERSRRDGRWRRERGYPQQEGRTLRHFEGPRGADYRQSRAGEGVQGAFLRRNCLPNPCLRQELGLYNGGLGSICRNASTFTFPRLEILIGHSHVRGEVRVGVSDSPRVRQRRHPEAS